MSIKLDTRNADMGELRRILEDQRARSIDIVANSLAVRAHHGLIEVQGTEQVELTEDGVTTGVGRFRPTRTFDTGLGDKLGIPTTFLGKQRTSRVHLYDALVNEFLHGFRPEEGMGYAAVGPDPRKFMLRLLKGDDGEEGVARAFLSDSYGRLDNLDVLVAALNGVRDAGVVLDPGSIQCDLTDSRMYVKVTVPQVGVWAKDLLANYRNPFGDGQARAGGWTLPQAYAAAAAEGQGYKPGEEPICWAGFVLGNSETGQGRFSLTPRIVFQPCRNGLTIPVDAVDRVHLGRRQDEGLIQWSAGTQQKELAWVTSRCQDAVATFLSKDYLERKVAELTELGGKPISSPVEAIATIVKATPAIPTGMEASVLDFFTKGGQVNAAGVMNAVTAAAQMVEDAEVAAGMEDAAYGVLRHAARIG